MRCSRLDVPREWRAWNGRWVHRRFVEFRRMQRVLLVCTANLCRSPMAEAVGRFITAARGLSSDIRFDSAGTDVPWPGSPTDVRARTALARRGYPPLHSRARAVVADDFHRHDRVLAMDRQHLARLRELADRAHWPKISLFLDLTPHRGRDVPDPYFADEHGFDRVLTLCEAGIEALLATGG